MISQASAAILGFVSLYFLTRHLDATAYGEISLALAIAATLNSIGDFGFNVAHIKRVSEGRDLDACLSTFVVIKIVLIAVMILATLIVAHASEFLFGSTLTAQGRELLLLFALFHVLYHVAGIATATFDARTETAKTQLSLIMDPLVRTPLIIIVTLGGIGALGVAWAYVAGGLAFTAFALLLLSRERIRWGRPVLIRSYVSFALPYSVTIILAAAVLNVDRMVVGAFWLASEVAYYTAALTIVTIISLMGTSLITIIFPTFSSLHAKGRLDQVRSLTHQAERYVSMASLPVIILFATLPAEVSIVLLGPSYLAASEPLRFLSIATYVSLLTGPYNIQVSASNRPLLSAKLSVISLVVNLSLLLVFVPVDLAGLGGTGAAVAKLITYIVLIVVTRALIRKLTGTMSNRRIVLHLVAASVTGIALFTVTQFFAPTGWLGLAALGLLTTGIFATVMYALGELRKEDVDFFRSTINMREMFRYLSGELGNKTH